MCLHYSTSYQGSWPLRPTPASKRPPAFVAARGIAAMSTAERIYLLSALCLQTGCRLQAVRGHLPATTSAPPRRWLSAADRR